MSRKPTVFINKYTTSETLGRSTYEERKLINEQNRARRTLYHCQPVCDPVTRSQSSSVMSVTHQRQLRQVQDKKFCFVEEAPWIRQSTSEPQNDAHNAGSNTSAQTLVPHMPGNTIDPFHTTSANFDTETAKILQYYKDILYDWIWENAAASVNFELDLEAMNVCTPQRAVAVCLQNKPRLQALVAHAASHMQHRSRIKLRTDSLEYVQEATNAFLGNFEAQNRVVDKWMLLHVFHLCAAAFASQQLDAMRIHINGYRALIDGMDGTATNIDAKTIAILSQIDIEAPSRLIQYLPPNQQAIWLRLAVNSCASSFDFDQSVLEASDDLPMLNRNEIVTSEMSQAVQKCRQFAAVFERAVNSGEDCYAVMRRLSIQNRTLYQQMLQFCVPDARSKCLLHALLIWLSNAHHLGSELVEAASIQVKYELQSIPVDDWVNSYDVLLWICLTVALSLTEGSSTLDYFWCQAIHLSVSQGIVDNANTDNVTREKTLKAFATGYLWLHALQDSKLHWLVSNSWS